MLNAYVVHNGLMEKLRAGVLLLSSVAVSNITVSMYVGEVVDRG